MSKIKWEKLGEGGYNKVYVNSERSLVLKIPKDMRDETDTPERSVRLWNLINPDLQPKAAIYNRGWTCPFVKGVQASDDDMVEALINIYQKTGRIIVDATAKKNFVKANDGKIVCVDIGMALDLESQEISKASGLRRIPSEVSLSTWDNLKDDYEDFFDTCAENNPKTVQLIKALIFIQKNRLDMLDVSFLRNNPELISKLACAYDCQVNDYSYSKILNEVTRAQKIKDVVTQFLIEADANNTNSYIEKQFIKESCEQIVKEIDLFLSNKIEGKESTKIDDRINSLLEEFLKSAPSIPETEGFSGIINNLSKNLGFTNPLIKKNTAFQTMQRMKLEIEQLKNDNSSSTKSFSFR